jgi:hypothetical protein
VRILFANEVGGGYGHIRNMLPIVDALTERGHDCLLSMPRLDGLDTLLRGRNVQLFLSPWMNTENHYSLTGRSAASFSDALGAHGYGDVDRLALLVSVWETMLKELEIDLVVGEHCPSLCLAVMGLVPIVLIGEDFSFPPADEDDFPPYNRLEPGFPIDFLLDNVAGVQRARGQRVPKTLTEIFRVAGRFVCSFPELDVFREIRKDPVIGPIDEPLKPMPPPPEPRIFLYLNPMGARVREALQMAVASKIPAEAHIFGVDPEYYAKFRGSGITFHPEPQPIADILARTTVVIHACGNGLMNNAAAAGRGQLLTVEHIGNLAHTRVLEDLGVGRRIAKVARDPKNVADIEIVRNAATSRTFMDRAQALAARIEAGGPRRPVAHIVNRCEEILEAPNDFIH